MRRDAVATDCAQIKVMTLDDRNIRVMKTTSPRLQVNLRLPEALHERLKLAAGERGVSVTREICDRAIDSLESKPKLPPPAPKKRRIDELQDELRKRDETIELLTQALKRDQEPTQLRDLSDTTQEPEHTGPLRHLVYEVPEAGAKLGLNRNASYGAAKRGEIPTIKIGRLLKVPKAAFHAKFGGQPS